jgi:hypothetical protein
MKYYFGVVVILIAFGAYYFLTSNTLEVKNTEPVIENKIQETVLPKETESKTSDSNVKKPSLSSENSDGAEPKVVTPVTSMVVDPKTAKVGDKVGSFSISDIFYSESPVESVMVQFVGTATVTGIIEADEMMGPGITLSSSELNKMPTISGYEVFDGNDPVKYFCVVGDVAKTLPQEVVEYTDGLNSMYEITAVVSDYRFTRQTKPSCPSATLLKIISVKKLN